MSKRLGGEIEDDLYAERKAELDQELSELSRRIRELTDKDETGRISLSVYIPLAIAILGNLVISIADFLLLSHAIGSVIDQILNR